MTTVWKISNRTDEYIVGGRSLEVFEYSAVRLRPVVLAL